VFYDRFGGELVTRKAAGGFEVSLPVQISPVFYSWLMGFGDRVRILSPAFVVTEFCDLARRVLGAYEEEKK
ncbi:MAG: WYL domain-containing protein, partial [Clostridia bacterium]|nr:WYL domain-containing protein [Clostridia bacterium]